MFCIGEIITCRTNCPGSWHDSRVAEGIYTKLENKTPDGFSLVADSAFPQGNDRVAGKIRVPLKAGEELPTNAVQRKYALELSRSILSYHQTAEWGMRELQGSFGRLRIPLGIEDMDKPVSTTCARDWSGSTRSGTCMFRSSVKGVLTYILFELIRSYLYQSPAKRTHEII